MLDPARFQRVVSVLALRIPNPLTEQVVKPLRDFGLRRPNVKIVLEDPSDRSKRLFLLSETLSRDAVPDEVARVLAARPEVELVSSEVVLSEANYTLEELLRSVIPAELELPSAYEAVGHIAHLNLRKELLPYKTAIGQALLAKLKQIKTVVNKLSTIHEVFRTFDMELLAGEPRYEVDLVEAGCRFRFDFRRVYWNSRLQVEHLRVVEACAPTDVVCDMFAGVGPFALPLARRGCRVLANDLNPESYAALVDCARLNKVAVEAFNLDARVFVRQLCDGATTAWPFSVVIMNLPKDAVEFLDVFVGAMPQLGAAAPGPTVYCYAFAKPEDDLPARVRRALGLADDDATTPLDVRKVRDISPQKFMYCVRLTIPRHVAVAPLNKRRRIEEGVGDKQ